MIKTPEFVPARVPSRAMGRALVLLLALVLTGCTLAPPAGERLAAEGTATADGVLLEVDRATVSLPGGAVAPGTTVSASIKAAVPPPPTQPPPTQPPAKASTAGVELLPAASDQLTVTVGEELAAGTSMTITIALSRVPERSGLDPAPASLALAHLRSGEEVPDLLRVSLIGETNTGRISAQVPAGGTFWAVYADVSSLLGEVSRTLAATETANKPPCADKPASVAGMRFTAASATASATTGSWACLREHNGMLVVAVAAKSAVPLRVASHEKLLGAPVLDEKLLQPYFRQVLQPLLERHKDLVGALPGVVMEYETAAAGVEHQEWELRPYPAMFLLKYVATVVQTTLDDAIEPATIDASRTAACVAPLLEANKEELALKESWAAPFVKDFMNCVATSLEISQRMDVLLGAVNAVPDVVAGAAILEWDELQPGQGTSVAIAGAMEWSTYSGTLNDARISFEHPVGWTVMDGSVNPQFGASNALVVYDHQGNRKAAMNVEDGAHVSGPVDLRPVSHLGGGSDAAPTRIPGAEVRAVAMDLSSQPQLRTRDLADHKVQFSMSLSTRSTDGAALKELAVGRLEGQVVVETGVRSRAQNQTQRYVMFAHSDGFETIAAAQEYAKGGEFRAIQKMLASFKG
ncbi:hypothetical protein [Arthrobacter sp. lap29]|uniref:hypothetical protein n=1 Tax=Arthrobacter sp. lap29 TaxID=3056122 RepID=UPI0028F6FBBF|nr:hypothetical protein [Arthrobacter sp. lap29]